MLPQVVLYDYAMRLVGLPYRWGGDDSVDGFDCSGLCVELLQSAGVFPKGKDSTASGLYDFYALGATETPSFGSLVFFGLPAISHIAFCLNKDLMLEAGGGGSKTTSREAAVEQNAFVRIRPIKWRNDIVGYRHPPYLWKA